ncbi:alpha/beta hydrolase [Gordonia sp. PKS22-38]|uniref:Alpha/beta hydrolase n=1 Tax=Gordonia prachuapensis TaxID=3115651 RepID=A0ABU7MYY9_9ACTN|nr:alpha/beta hydrolase [Gordonia sp. PKS22-38]
MTPGQGIDGPPGVLTTVGGRRLHVVDEGAGPPLLLMAALGSSWWDLDPLASRLAAGGWRVIRYDRPGYGLSDPPGRGEHPTLLGEVDRMAAVLDTAGVQTPAAVVGHSLASLYVEAFGRVHPDRTAALVVIDGSFSMTPVHLVPRAWSVWAARWLSDHAQAICVWLGVDRWPRERVWRLVVPPPPEGFTADHHRWVGQLFGRAPFLAALVAENAMFGAMDRTLRRLRHTNPLPAVPSRVIVAAPRTPGWRQFWEWKQRRYAALLGADVDVIPRARHFVVSQRPDEVAVAIDALAVG